MADDLARAHAAGVHRDDLLVEAGKAALVLGDQLRIEAAWRSRGTSSSICPVSVTTVFLP